MAVTVTTPTAPRWHEDAYRHALLNRSDLPAAARMLAVAYSSVAVDEHNRRSAAGDLASLTYDDAQKKSGIGKRTSITKWQKHLVDTGWLQVVRAVHRRPTLYRLTIPVAAVAAAPVDDVAPGEGTTGTDDSSGEGTTGTVDGREGTTDAGGDAPGELPDGSGGSDVGTTDESAAQPDEQKGTTVVPFSGPGSSHVGTTVVPTGELLISSEDLSSSSARPATVAYVADLLKIDDDDASAVIKKIKAAAPRPILSLAPYLRSISEPDFRDHLAELREARALPSQRGDTGGASVLQFPRRPPIAGDEVPAWRALAADRDRALTDPGVLQRRRAAITAAAEAIAAAGRPPTKTRPTNQPLAIDVALADLYPPASSEAPKEEVAA